MIEQIEERIGKIETDIAWLKRINWLLFSLMLANLVVTIFKHTVSV